MTEGKKWKFNIITKYGDEEPFTGLFKNRDEADKWYAKHGAFHRSQGRKLILIESQSPEEISEEGKKIGNC
jgi:hypothetical protein